MFVISKLEGHPLERITLSATKQRGWSRVCRAGGDRRRRWDDSEYLVFIAR